MNALSLIPAIRPEAAWQGRHSVCELGGVPPFGRGGRPLLRSGRPPVAGGPAAADIRQQAEAWQAGGGGTSVVSRVQLNMRITDQISGGLLSSLDVCDYGVHERAAGRKE